MSDAKDIEAFDESIPEHFKRVSKMAFDTALESGNPVTIATDGAIWRYVKTGETVERTKIKDIEPDVSLERNRKLPIKL